jgi:hypothetical protein
MRTRRISPCCGLRRNQSSRSQLRAACHRPAPGLGSSGSMRGHRQSPDAARAFFSSCVRLGPGGCSKGAARGMPGGTQVRNTGRGSGRARSRADLGETARFGRACAQWPRQGGISATTGRGKGPFAGRGHSLCGPAMSPWTLGAPRGTLKATLGPRRV